MEAVFLVLFICAVMGVPREEEDPHHSKNFSPLDVVRFNSNCSRNDFTVELLLNRPFAGIVYAKGFPYSKGQTKEQRCYLIGTGKETLKINLKTNACGVRLAENTEGKLQYTVTLVVQSDRLLQQVSNFEVPTSCVISERPGNSRAGKSLTQFGNEVADDVRAWMEMESNVKGNNIVALGSPLRVLVKADLPNNLSACVGNCIAYDGLSERSENLTDANGCSYDESLMPSMKNFASVKRPFGSSHVEVIGTSFPAFKFSDTASLHLKCTLNIYKNHCPQVSCDSDRRKRSTEDLRLRKLEIFNSIQVLAPGLEELSEIKEEQAVIENGGEMLCLSVTDVAIHVGLLGGLIFLLSFVVFFLWKSSLRKRHEPFPGGVIIVKKDTISVQARSRGYNNLGFLA